MGIHREEGGLTFARINWKTPVIVSALQPIQSSLPVIYWVRIEKLFTQYVGRVDFLVHLPMAVCLVGGWTSCQ